MKNLLFLPPDVQSKHTILLKKSDFNFSAELGKGAFGTVYKAQHKKTKAIYAIKKMVKSFIINQRMEDQVKKEVKILYSLCHKNIIKLYTHFETKSSIYLVMEYAPNGNLYEYLKSKKVLSELEAAKIISQIIEAINYIHSKPKMVVHRDLKLENILVMEDHNIKVTDFGWSSMLENDKKRLTFCGTLEYLPPEMINNQEYGIEVDIWTIGIILYELVNGTSPFLSNSFKIGKTKEDVQNIILKNIVTLNYTFNDKFSNVLKSLIKKILVYKESRISLKEIMNHIFFKRNDIQFANDNMGIGESKIDFSTPYCNYDEAIEIVNMGSIFPKRVESFYEEDGNKLKINIFNNKDNEKEDNKIKELSKKIEELQSIIDTKNDIITEYESQILKLNVNNMTLTKFNEELITDKSKLISEIENLKSENYKLFQDTENLRIEIPIIKQNYNKNISDLDYQLTKKNEEIANLNKMLKEYKYNILNNNNNSVCLKNTTFNEEVSDIFNNFINNYKNIGDFKFEKETAELRNMNIDITNLLVELNNDSFKLKIREEIKNEYYEKIIAEKKKHNQEIKTLTENYQGIINKLKEEIFDIKINYKK